MKTLILAIVCCVVQTKFIHANDHYETIQVWNFLKYYHPDLASGKVNADSLFLLHIDNRNADLNQRIELFTKNLSNNFTQTTSSKANGDVIQKNQDFSWFENSTVISKNNKQLLSRIYANRYRGTTHHFVPTQGYETDLPNELAYDFEKQDQLPLNYRLLALARIIGAMDYLYPHKYLLSNDTEKTLRKLVDETLVVTSRKEFERILCKAVATFEDTHAFKFYNQLQYKKEIYFTTFYAPFDFQVRENYIVVTHIIHPALCQQANIAVGDHILAINGKPIVDIIIEKRSLLSVSNTETLLHRLSDYQNNLIWSDARDTKKITIKKPSKEENFVTTVKLIHPADQQNIDLVKNYLKDLIIRKQQVKLHHPDIAYFRIDQTFSFIEEVDDSAINGEMERIFEEASTKKALVFDMRAYPDWGGFVYTYLYSYFGGNSNFFGKYYQQNHADIGTFIYNNEAETYFPTQKLFPTHSYSGKVYIITNPETLSASEWNTMNLQNLFPNAITIGQTTAGADGDIKKMTLPGNYVFEFTGNAIFYPNGDQTQQKGIKVNRYIELTDEDYIHDRPVIFSIIEKEL